MTRKETILKRVEEKIKNGSKISKEKLLQYAGYYNEEKNIEYVDKRIAYEENIINEKNRVKTLYINNQIKRTKNKLYRIFSKYPDLKNKIINQKLETEEYLKSLSNLLKELQNKIKIKESLEKEKKIKLIKSFIIKEIKKNKSFFINKNILEEFSEKNKISKKYLLTQLSSYELFTYMCIHNKIINDVDYKKYGYEKISKKWSLNINFESYVDSWISNNVSLRYRTLQDHYGNYILPRFEYFFDFDLIVDLSDCFLVNKKLNLK